MRRFLRCVLIVLPSLTALARADALEIRSPDGHIRADVDMHDGSLRYRIELNGQEMLAWSPLGVDTTTGDFTKNVAVVQTGAVEDVSQSYRLVGKASRVEAKARQATITIANSAAEKLDVRLRVLNDGVAFSYRLVGDKDATIMAETTGFALPTGTTGFLHPMAVSKTGWSRTQPSYEEHYVYNHPIGEPSPMGQGWCLPALFNVSDRGWVLIGETGVDASYCGARLAHDSPEGVYRIELPQSADHLPESPVEPLVKAGHWMPWRFVVIGKTLAPIVASTMATDLVEPLYDLEWAVKPGRATWSWLKLKDGSCVESVQREFIDLAATLEFEYVLIDALWDTQIGKEKIAELVQYAKSKGVAVILWYNSNGSWNDAPQGPRDRMHSAESRAEEMAWLQRIGVAGLKVDFFGGDKQADMALYDSILRDAAKHGLCINFHGTTIPRGWDRMYPNLVTCEAVRGMEFCTFAQNDADHQPEHCATLPFTRNVVGPMDFTPLIIDRGLSPDGGGPRRRTSLAFELALPVVIQSAVQHFGLIPDDLKNLPDFAVEYLRATPTTWDETRLLGGYPGRLAVIARRKGERWYVAAINGSKDVQHVTIPTDLATSWSVIRDGNNDDLTQETLAAGAGEELSLDVPARGGAIFISQ